MWQLLNVTILAPRNNVTLSDVHSTASNASFLGDLARPPPPRLRHMNRFSLPARRGQTDKTMESVKASGVGGGERPTQKPGEVWRSAEVGTSTVPRMQSWKRIHKWIKISTFIYWDLSFIREEWPSRHLRWLTILTKCCDVANELIIIRKFPKMASSLNLP